MFFIIFIVHCFWVNLVNFELVCWPSKKRLNSILILEQNIPKLFLGAKTVSSHNLRTNKKAQLFEIGAFLFIVRYVIKKVLTNILLKIRYFKITIFATWSQKMEKLVCHITNIDIMLVKETVSN